MANVLRICPCHYGSTCCPECTIGEQFNVGYLKMLYIRCLPTDADIINVLILLLIEVSGNDPILKIFKSIDVSLLGCHKIHYLDVASKRILYHTQIRDLRNVGFDVVVPKPIHKVDGIYRCWLGLADNTVLNKDSIFCDLLSQSVRFWFDISNCPEHIIDRSSRYKF